MQCATADVGHGLCRRHRSCGPAGLTSAQHGRVPTELCRGNARVWKAVAPRKNTLRQTDGLSCAYADPLMIWVNIGGTSDQLTVICARYAALPPCVGFSIGSDARQPAVGATDAPSPLRASTHSSGIAPRRAYARLAGGTLERRARSPSAGHHMPALLNVLRQLRFTSQPVDYD